MTKEWKEEFENLLFRQEKNQETLEEVHKIYQKTAKFLQNYPFVNYPFPGYEAFRFVCSHFKFDTVLDVGCGEGFQSKAFLDEGKTVTAIDYGKSNRVGEFKENEKFHLIIDDFNKYIFDGQFDLVWTCHVLEHQLNIQAFLEKIVSFVREGGG